MHFTYDLLYMLLNRNFTLSINPSKVQKDTVVTTLKENMFKYHYHQDHQGFLSTEHISKGRDDTASRERHQIERGSTSAISWEHLKRLGPPCLAKCSSFVKSMFSLPLRWGGTGAVGRTVLRSNSHRARRASYCRERLSQNTPGVRYRRWSSSYLSFDRTMRRQVGFDLRLRFASLALSIVRYESFRQRHWTSTLVNVTHTNPPNP